jgi:hypothetical protein
MASLLRGGPAALNGLQMHMYYALTSAVRISRTRATAQCLHRALWCELTLDRGCLCTIRSTLAMVHAALSGQCVVNQLQGFNFPQTC